MASNTRLLWLDMEMTGLDVTKEVPIEIAAIVTDMQFNSLVQYHAVIRQPASYLEAMDDWNKRQHKQSGLVDLVPNGKDPAVVDRELAALVRQYFGTDRAILCGNSIAQDRLFIRAYMTELEACLHYRTVDVTSWKVIFNEVYKRKFEKKDGHRALDDILESIAELKFYMSFVKV